MAFKHIVTFDDVETQVFGWGKLTWMNEPRVTGTKNMTSGIVDINIGCGHDTHFHEGREELFYIISGKGVQTIDCGNGKIIKEDLNPGDVVSIPAGAPHSTFNTSDKEHLVLFAVYQFSGPEAELRAAADSIEPPKNK